MSAYFKTQQGCAISCCQYKDWVNYISELRTQEGLDVLQLVEGCGYSFAMVIRYALGLSAYQGTVTAFASDTFFGWITLAAARHILNGGGIIKVVEVEEQGLTSSTARHLTTSLIKRGAKVVQWRSTTPWSTIEQSIIGSHNVICGFSDIDSSNNDTRFVQTFTEYMNDSNIPVHVIASPIPVHLETSTELYASSTLSVGVPLDILTKNRDLIGRHYLCDLGFSLDLYRSIGYKDQPLFAEQPVIQLATE